jgi:hypothetical protein
MKRARHFDEYSDTPEIVPGVFVAPGSALYIVDEQGEVCSWNYDEICEDGEAFTAAINAAILATAKGANAVRQNIESKGITIAALQTETFKKLGLM